MLPSVAPSRRVRRVLAASTAALLLTSAGAALAHGGGPARRHHRQGIAGTVASIDAPNFTLTTRRGATVTVATDGETRFSKTVDATVAEATPGSFVAAHGRPHEDGSLAAHHLAIFPAPPAKPSEPRRDDADRSGHVHGTVVTNDGSTLVVETPWGSSRTVTTSAETRVTRTYATDFGELAVGDRVKVRGSRGDDRTFAASGVHIDAVTPPPRPTGAKPAPAARPAPPARPAPTVSVPEPTVATPSASGAVRIPDPLRPGHRPSPRPGDRDRDGTAGTVKAISAPDFVVAHERGQTTVATTDATTFRKHVDATFADATPGKGIVTGGRRNPDGSMTALFVDLRPEAAEHPSKGGCEYDRCFVAGTVKATDAATRTITVVSGDGEIVVHTTDDTRFAETRHASFSDLAVGQHVAARGTRTSATTLSADAVFIEMTTRPAKDPSFAERDGYEHRR